jgi:hypothetical protein
MARKCGCGNSSAEIRTTRREPRLRAMNGIRNEKRAWLRELFWSDSSCDADVLFVILLLSAYRRRKWNAGIAHEGAGDATMRAWRANHQIAPFVAVRAGSAKITRKSLGAARATGRTRAIAAGQGCRASGATHATMTIHRKCRRDTSL